MPVQLTPFDAHVAELVSSLRSALEPQKSPAMLVSFGRWALVQRESLAIRAASPLAVAMVSDFSFFFFFSKSNLVDTLFPRQLNLLFLFSLPPSRFTTVTINSRSRSPRALSSEPSPRS